MRADGYLDTRKGAPVPDLVVEIDRSVDSSDKLAPYFRMGVREAWTWSRTDGVRVWIAQTSADGAFTQSDRSHVLPGLDRQASGPVAGEPDAAGRIPSRTRHCPPRKPCDAGRGSPAIPTQASGEARHGSQHVRPAPDRPRRTAGPAGASEGTDAAPDRHRGAGGGVHPCHPVPRTGRRSRSSARSTCRSRRRISSAIWRSSWAQCLAGARDRPHNARVCSRQQCSAGRTGWPAPPPDFVAALLAAALIVLPVIAFVPTGERLLRNSVLAPYVTLFSDLANAIVPEELAEQYRERMDALRGSWRQRWDAAGEEGVDGNGAASRTSE